jgi:hypothetical protein
MKSHLYQDEIFAGFSGCLWLIDFLSLMAQYYYIYKNI